MTETHRTEKIGFDILMDHLAKRGTIVEKSDKKEYDLKVNGQYCELKTKRYSSTEFDFFYISKNQQTGICSGEMATLYLVCNTDNPEHAEIFAIPGSELNDIEPKSEIKHYYDKGLISSHFTKWLQS